MEIKCPECGDPLRGTTSRVFEFQTVNGHTVMAFICPSCWTELYMTIQKAKVEVEEEHGA